MQRMLESYLADCTVRGLSPATISTYRIYIRPFLDIAQTPRGLRDRAIYTLLMFTACRRDAIRCLRHENLMLADGLIQVREKGGKHPYKPLVPAAVRALNAWLEHAPASPYVFPSCWHPEKPVDGGMITKYLQRYARKAGIQRRVYIHLLRHSAANILLEADVPIDAVQAILGHSHIRTTQIYARTSPGRIRAGLEAAFGSL